MRGGREKEEKQRIPSENGNLRPKHPSINCEVVFQVI